MEAELDRINVACQVCQKCSLCHTRTNLVFSDGKPNTKLVLIGEAPGFNEDQEGKPFVGRSGKLLDQIFASVNLSREKDIYICNTIKCRPPNNRNPSREEMLACKEYLDAQLNILKPRIIILCGAIAVSCFIGSGLGITKIRGKWFDGPYNSQMMPIFHPAYLLRNPTREKGGPKWLMWQDIQEIKRVYDTIK